MPAELVGVNEVRLVGRVASAPQMKEMPSGDPLWVCRVVVPRAHGRGERAAVDALECSAWGRRVQRAVAGWRAGDTVEVEGSLRRRFYTAGSAKVSRVDVEVLRGRLIRRATT